MLKENRAINLDANATYGISDELWDYLRSALGSALNASSVHYGGQRAKSLIEDARDSLRQLLGAPDAQVLFCSGATEANNHVVEAVFRNEPLRYGSFITSAIEHHSVLEPARRIENLGGEVCYLPADILFAGNAGVQVQQALLNMKSRPALVSLMWANNETGDLLPVREIFSVMREVCPQAIFHSDTVQALGKLAFSFDSDVLDAISLSAHKIGALPGCGALILRQDLSLPPLLLGGAQEGHKRAGTENLPGIVSFGYMARKLSAELQRRISRMQSALNVLKESLREKLPGVSINSLSEHGLPNTVNLRINGVRTDDLVVALDLEGVYVSSAAACASGKPETSHVLRAYGYSAGHAGESVRLSLSAESSEEDMLEAASKISACVARMRNSGITGNQEQYVSRAG